MYNELNRSAIAVLIDDFYTDIRGDSALRPIFDNAVGDNWTPHLARMVDFWCSVMLSSGEFKGNVYGKHMLLAGVEPDHFRRWLALFDAQAQRLFVPEHAEQFMLVARRIGASLQYGFFGRTIAA